MKRRNHLNRQVELEIRIGQVEHDFIKIDVLDRSDPNATDFYYGNWLNVKVAVEVGRFSGLVTGQLRAEELASLQADLEKLHRSLSGSVKFSTMENWMSFELMGDGKGHIACTGRVADEYGHGNRLNFYLSIDQTYLPEILNDLQRVNSTFPVHGSK